MTSKPTWQCSLDSADADLSTRGLEEQVKREMLAKSERGEKVKLTGAMMERGTPMEREWERERQMGREWERERDRKDAMERVVKLEFEWRMERERERLMERDRERQRQREMDYQRAWDWESQRARERENQRAWGDQMEDAFLRAMKMHVEEPCPRPYLVKPLQRLHLGEARGLFHNLFTQPPSNMSHGQDGSTGTPATPMIERLTEAQRRELFQPFIAVDRMGQFYIPWNFTVEAPKTIPYRGSPAPEGPSAPEGSSAPDGPSDSGDVVAVSRAVTATASDEDREAVKLTQEEIEPSNETDRAARA